MSEQGAQDHRLLKAIVIGLGIALVIGFGLLMWGLVSGGGRPPGGPPSPLVLPEGVQVTQMAVSDKVLALKVEGPGTQEILLLDARNGRVLRHIPISHGTPPHAP